jgi:hypothetical protein
MNIARGGAMKTKTATAESSPSKERTTEDLEAKKDSAGRGLLAFFAVATALMISAAGAARAQDVGNPLPAVPPTPSMTLPPPGLRHLQLFREQVSGTYGFTFQGFPNSATGVEQASMTYIGTFTLDGAGNVTAFTVQFGFSRAPSEGQTTICSCSGGDGCGDYSAPSGIPATLQLFQPLGNSGCGAAFSFVPVNGGRRLLLSSVLLDEGNSFGTGTAELQ